jgi:hypothetical protein
VTRYARTRYDLRVVWLFGKPYWWEYGPYGQLALRPAPWEEARNGADMIRVLDRMRWSGI